MCHRSIVPFATMFLALCGAAPSLRGQTTGIDSTHVDSAHAPNTAARGRRPAQLADVTVKGAQARSQGYVAHRDAAGTKVDLPILSIPQTITVVTRDQMNAQHVQTIPQALRYVPGILTETWGADARFDAKYSSMIVRGFAPEEYLDGMKVLAGVFTTPQPDPYAMESIAFLQGPASVLYGQTEPGGVFNLMSKQPPSTPLREVDVQTGNYHRAQVAVDMGGPLDALGRYRYRFTALARDADTQVDFQKSQRVLVAPAFTWEPNDGTTLTLLTSYQRDPHAGFYYYYPMQGTLLPNPDGAIPSHFYAGDATDSYTLSQGSAGWLLAHRVNDVWSIEQHARYSVVTNAINMVYPIGFAMDTEGEQHFGVLDRDVFANHERLGAVTVDNQARATFSTGMLRHTVLMGLDLQNSRMTRSFADVPGPSIDIANPDYHQSIPVAAPDYRSRQTQSQGGGYVQDIVDAGHWLLMFGGRLDGAKTTTRDFSAEVTTTQSDHAPSGRAGIVYRFDNGVAPYASYATSFQPTSGTDYFNKPFQPTTGQQAEVGIKYQPHAFNALFSAAVYTLTQQNVMTPDLAHKCSATPAPPNCGDFSVQTGEVRSRGFELSAVTSPVHGLDVTTSYAYLDNTITKANDETVGKRNYGVPANTASMWGDYTISSGAFTGVGISAGARYIGWTYADATNTMTVPSVTLADGGVHYAFRDAAGLLAGWQLSVNAKNLFDKSYLAACDGYGCFFGNRRSILAGVTRRW